MTMLTNFSFLRLFDEAGGNITTAVIIASISLYLFLYHLQKQKSHPDEPDIIAPRVPFVGHLLGMAIHGGRYVKGIGIRNNAKPIFTLPVPASRIYIVTDPSLAAAVQRASKTLSFTPLVPDLTKRVLGLDAPTVHMIRQNLDPEPGEPRGFLSDIHDLVYTHLGPGESLTELSLGAARELAAEVNAYAASLNPSPEPGVGRVHQPEVNLLHWIRHFVTTATATFLYGPTNPLASDPSLEDAFWDFDHGLGLLLMNVFPAVTARKAYTGRERLAAALGTYLERGGHKTASTIVQKRVETALRHGWTLRGASRSEVSFLFAGIVNTATTTFWVVAWLFAGGDGGRLVERVRGELVGSGAVVEGEDGEGDEDGKGGDGAGLVKGKKKKWVLDLDKVRNGSSCPTLMAVFRECLRVGSDNYSTRLVKADTMLAGRYFLKGGSVVQIAGGVMHADERIWGADADVFNPGRFLGGGDKGKGGESTGTNVHPAAFRAFGGGKTLCPGRHFAINEILAFVAMIVLTFDLEAVAETDSDGMAVKGKGGHQIRVPEKDDGVLPVHILEPKEDVKVRVVVRDGRRIEVI